MLFRLSSSVTRPMVAAFSGWPKAGKWVDLFDSASVIVRALRDPGLIVKAGEYIDERAYEAILIRVTNDPDFPGKTPEKASIMGQLDG